MTILEMKSKTYIGVGRTSSGDYSWWLATASGERLFNSEPFSSKEACERAIKLMKRELLSAPIMDISAHANRPHKRMRLVA